MVGFCDVDLATPLDDVARIFEAAARGDVIAIASRDLAASQLVRHESVVRETLGRVYNRLVQVLLTPGIVDTQCGAKAAPRKVWERLLPSCREDGFAFDVELVALARAAGIGVQEVPVRWAHDPDSRVRVVRDGLAMLAALPRVRRSLVRAPAVPAAEIFDDRNVPTLVSAEGHWWFRSKASFVASVVRDAPKHGWLVDLGAGSGSVTAMIGWDVSRCVAVDGSEPLARRARTGHGLLSACGALALAPIGEASAAVVCLLDVIEHVDDPVAALREAGRLLRPDGRLVIDVPAHPRLWSKADEFLGHRRRYTRRMLREQLAAAGLRPVRMTHVFSWLVLPVWLTRRTTRDAESQLGLSQRAGLIDAAALILTAIERSVVRFATLPVGTSILCVASSRSRTDGD